MFKRTKFRIKYKEMYFFVLPWCNPSRAVNLHWRLKTKIFCLFLWEEGGEVIILDPPPPFSHYYLYWHLKSWLYERRGGGDGIILAFLLFSSIFFEVKWRRGKMSCDGNHVAPPPLLRLRLSQKTTSSPPPSKCAPVATIYTPPPSPRLRPSRHCRPKTMTC